MVCAGGCYCAAVGYGIGLAESVMDEDETAVQWWQTKGVHEATRPSWISLYETNTHKDTNMKISDLIPSKYLKQSDVTEDTLVTVAALKKTNVARDDEAPDYKYTIKFEEFDKPMVLNSTNIKRLGKALGDDTDDWIGGKVTLYVDPDVEYGGEVKGGLRIRGNVRKAAPKRMNDDDINRALDDGRDPADVPF